MNEFSENSPSPSTGEGKGEGVITFDAARGLKTDEIHVGLKVTGKTMPFGGSWIYDPQADELMLAEAPPREKE